MDASEATLDALWLTALRWDDASLDTVAACLPPDWVQAVRQRRARLSGMHEGDKAREVRRMVGRLREPLPNEARLPARALGLLCSEVDRETGRRWAQAAGTPRRGFAASPALRSWLSRLARRHTP